MKSEAIQKLLESKKMAAAQVAAVKDSQAAGTLTRERLREALFSYVLAKYLLRQEETTSRSILDLAQRSLAKAIKIDRKLVAETDQSATCDGASSVDMKQALLIMAIQREFTVKLDGIKAAYAETTDDLADLIHLQLATSVSQPCGC